MRPTWQVLDRVVMVTAFGEAHGMVGADAGQGVQEDEVAGLAGGNVNVEFDTHCC